MIFERIQSGRDADAEYEMRKDLGDYDERIERVKASAPEVRSAWQARLQAMRVGAVQQQIQNQ
jgi:hypothetical protein